MGKFNTFATKALVTGTVFAGGMLVVPKFDDGIAGCIEKEGSLHFQMDSGDISAEPITALKFGDDDNCIVSHGGNAAPDVYERVDVVGSGYAKSLVEAAAGFSNEKWEEVQPTNEVGSFETYVGYSYGSSYLLIDESGDAATNVLATTFSNTLMPISQGTLEHPERFIDESPAGSVVVAYESDDGIRVARVPYDSAPVIPNP